MSTTHLFIIVSMTPEHAINALRAAHYYSKIIQLILSKNE